MIPKNLEEEFKIIEIELNQLEKILIFTQNMISSINIENNHSYSKNSPFANDDKSDINSKYKEFIIIIKMLRSEVDIRTTKSNKDLKENSTYESFDFIKKTLDNCTKLNKEIFEIVSNLFLDKTIKSFAKDLVNLKGSHQFKDKRTDWNNFEVPEEIYDEEFTCVNLSYKAINSKNTLNPKNKAITKNIVEELKVNYLLFLTL